MSIGHLPFLGDNVFDRYFGMMVTGSFECFCGELDGLSGAELQTRHALLALFLPERLTVGNDDIGNRADL